MCVFVCVFILYKSCGMAIRHLPLPVPEATRGTGWNSLKLCLTVPCSY